jgi:hypothetical protein
MKADDCDDPKWRRIVSGGLLYGGIAGAISMEAISWSLLLYYAYTRPIVPQPSAGWTVHLPWIWAYGTYAERERLFWLHSWGGLSVLSTFAGWAMRNWWSFRASMKAY